MVKNISINKNKDIRETKKSTEESTVGLILLIAIAIGGLLIPSGIGLDSGDGTAVDSIHGIEKTGWVFSTYKVYLTNDHGLANSDWNGVYSVDKNDEELIAQIQKASETYDSKDDKIKVKITYHTHMFVWGWDYGSRTVITKVETI